MIKTSTDSINHKKVHTKSQKGRHLCDGRLLSPLNPDYKSIHRLHHSLRLILKTWFCLFDSFLCKKKKNSTLLYTSLTQYHMHTKVLRFNSWCQWTLLISGFPFSPPSQARVATHESWSFIWGRAISQCNLAPGAKKCSNVCLGFITDKLEV